MLDGASPTLYGYGKPMRDYVFVGDIARAVLLSLDRGDGQTVNLGSGRGTTVREIFDILKEIMHFDKEPILKHSRLGEVDCIYTTGDRARDVLRWEPEVGLREGLQRTLDHISRQRGQR